MPDRVTIKSYLPQEKQILYHQAPHRNKLYGGAMGGGKTRTLCEEVHKQMRRYDGNRGLIVRKFYSDFIISTYIILKEQVLKEFLEAGIVTENRSKKFFQYWNGSRLDYGGLQVGDGTAKEHDKYFSTEYGCIAIDEAREVSENEFKKLGTRLRHRLPRSSKHYYNIDALKEKRPPYHMLLASNPSQNWLKARFILRPNPALDIFIPALPSENKYNPEDYETHLQELFRGDEKMIQAYVKGSWDSIKSINDVLSMDEVEACIDAQYVNDSKYYKEFTVYDAARFGDDTTVIMDWKDLVVRLEDIEYYGKRDTMETVGRLQYHIQKNNSNMVGGDIIYAPGIQDRLYQISQALKSQGKESFATYPIDFREASTDPSCFNLRSQVIWEGAQRIKDRQMPIPDMPRLHSEMCAYKYKFVGSSKGTRIQILSKDEMKKPDQLGHSPDFGDTYFMGLWLFDHVPVKKRNIDQWIDEYRKDQNRSTTPMAC